jgi:hypothetical protein
MEFSVRTLGSALLAVLGVACTHPGSAPCLSDTSRRVAEEETWLKDWALSRCIAKAAQGENAGKDASSTAAALLERGSRGMDTYANLDRVVDSFLARHYGGSVPGEYKLLKCIDLYHSPEVARIAHGH